MVDEKGSQHYFSKDGRLYFYDETGDEHGPYNSPAERKYEFERYCEYLNTGDQGIAWKDRETSPLMEDLENALLPPYNKALVEAEDDKLIEAMLFKLAPQQQEATELAKKWWKVHDEYPEEAFAERPIFRLFGFAGTGKTTTIRALIAELGLEMGSDVLFAAYTGKAALVMQRNGLPARTIHSLIYIPKDPDKKKCEELHKALKNCDDPDEKKRIRKDLQEASQVSFHLRQAEETDLTDARLLVLDECSMVNDDMMKDLMKFNVPMLVLGDPGQLPPVKGEGALIRDNADYTLTEIHRQAAGNPIIDFATKARNGLFIPKMKFGESEHLSKLNLSNEAVLGFDQILTGQNKTRFMLNQRIRDLLGFHETYPQIGDKLICLRNDNSKGLFNGLICTVEGVGDLLMAHIELQVRPEPVPGQEQPMIEVKALRAHFDAYHDKEALDNVKWWERAEGNEFDFGYAITVHKSQGSQWDRVLLWDDNFLVWEKPTRRKWLYTGITRAVQSITIAS